MGDKSKASMTLKLQGTEIGFCLFRPHLKEFLIEVLKHYEVAIFTASQPVYAN